MPDKFGWDNFFGTTRLPKKQVTLPKFFVGDKVRHIQINMIGEVIRVCKEVNYPGIGPARKVYYKGWNSFDPEQVDWTWDFALEVW